MLGLAFDPLFAQNGYFYVDLTNAAGDTEVRRYHVSANPDVADPSSGQLIIRIDQPDGSTNHKAGWIGFGQDNDLYVALGDGGGAGDPFGSGQNKDSLLGKMLRLDISSDDFPADPNRNYHIPGDNPFVNQAGADEIYAYGLRNPFRNSFDRVTDTLFIADVGQDKWEEIDIGQLGANYGWNLYEGPEAFTPGASANGLTMPIFSYGHNIGHAVIGGYVYRGRSDFLQGQYFYADEVNNFVATLRFDGSQWVSTNRTFQFTAGGTLTNPSGFGEDARANLYITDLDGEVFRLDFLGTSFDGNDAITAGGGNDAVYGGAGRDTAVYSGVRTSYVIARNASGTITIADIRGGSPDGTDQLTGIERLQFANATVSTLAANDYTGDLGGDILWREAGTGAVTVWKLVAGQFSASTQLGGVGASMQIAGNGDLNADGTSDVLLRDLSSGAVTDWTLNNGQFVGAHAVGGVGANIDVAGTGDFNADGNADILLRDRITGAVTNWTVSNNLFTGSHSLGNVGSSIDVAGVGNFNGDGTSDVLLRDRNGGAVSIWTVNSSNVFGGSQAIGGIGGNIDIAGAGDFDGDGTSDVLLRDRTTGAVSYWAVVNNAFAGSTQIGGVGGNFQIGGARDVNGDGFADVLLRDTTTGAVGAFTVVNGAFQQYVALGGVGSNIQFAG